MNDETDAMLITGYNGQNDPFRGVHRQMGTWRIRARARHGITLRRSTTYEAAAVRRANEIKARLCQRSRIVVATGVGNTAISVHGPKKRLKEKPGASNGRPLGGPLAFSATAGCQTANGVVLTTAADRRRPWRRIQAEAARWRHYHTKLPCHLNCFDFRCRLQGPGRFQRTR